MSQCNPNCHNKLHSECPVEYHNDTSDIYCMDDPRPDSVHCNPMEITKEINELLSWLDGDRHLVGRKLA